MSAFNVVGIVWVALAASFFAFSVWAERQRRETRRRSRDLHRRLSWYIHGRGL